MPVQTVDMPLQTVEVRPLEETDADRRRGILGDHALSVELVSAFAGDRLLSRAEHRRLEGLKQARGRSFFSDLLYAITHQYYPPENAEKLWAAVLVHKQELSTLLGRNVRTVVATLDYLSNITSNMASATLVGETVIEEILELSLRDGLTMLFNHTYFFEQIDLEVRRFLRYGLPVCLVLIDIDDFKAVNDTCGHQEGDRILATMGATLLRVARDSDICCRYGGEEFAVILPLIDIDEAGMIAERMRAEMMVPLADGRIVTVSIGVAACGEKIGNCQEFVEQADAALYQAKRTGKNRVVVGRWMATKKKSPGARVGRGFARTSTE